MKLVSRTALIIGLASFASPSIAQESAQSDGRTAEEELGDDVILVLASRLFGQVEAPEPPILELDSEDIAAYGAGSIDELLQSISSQVTSNRGRGGGRPILLVNGVRISSPRELRSYPPEAINKVEVFNEETAQRYGFSADQRVVNFVLKDNFSSREIELEYGQPYDGGFSTQEVEATYLLINGADRLNFNFGWGNSSKLTEGERGVIEPEGSQAILPGDPDPAFFRTLVNDDASLEATANWSTRLSDNGNSLSLNATFERDESLSFQGLDPVLLAETPLSINRRSETYSTGATVGLGLGGWQVTSTIDGSRADSRSLIEQGTGLERASSRTDSANALTTARGTLFELPAGDVALTFDGGYSWDRITSEDTRTIGAQNPLTRGDLSAGVNISLPLTERGYFAGLLGDFTLNASAGINELSDFGTLTDWSLGLTWGLTDKLNLNVNYINRDAAPSLGQLGNPEIATSNVSTFDLVNNETVLATIISGGNPDLVAQNQSDWKLGLVWQMPLFDRANFTLDYIRNHSENVTSSFPTLTPEIEAAFADRITRDAGGRLTQIDRRAVTFASQDVERLQFGFNFSGPISGNEESAAQNGGGFGGGRAGRGGRGGGAGQAPNNAAGPNAGAGRPNGPSFEAMAAMRKQFCETEPASLIALFNAALKAQANGEEPPVSPETGEPIIIPPQMLQRLTAEDGTIDEQRFGFLRERICSNDGPPAFAGGASGGPPPQGGAAPSGNGPPRGGGAARGPRGPRGPGGPGGRPGFGGSGGGRWFVNLNYRLDLENTVLIAPGLAELDLLDGDALSGSQSRHSATARGGLFFGGFGSFVQARYVGSSRIDGDGSAASTDLVYNDIATLNWRIFADLGRQEKLVENHPIFKNMRISFDVDNIFDARQRITDSTGDVPLRFQPFLIDPVGRSFEIEIRKLF